MQVKMGDGTTYELTREVISKRDGEPVTAYGACILDGNVRGVYTARALIELANGHGAQLEVPSGEGPGFEDEIDASEAAIEFLNRSIDTESEDARRRELETGPVSFGWHEGSIFLANGIWWEAD